MLVDLVEADRRVPRQQRQALRAHDPIGSPGMVIFHPGWLERQRRVPEVDLQTLASAGLLQRDYVGGDTTYFVTPAGFARYAELKRALGEPVERIERQVRRYFDSEKFQARHPQAFAKWQAAEHLLWGDESQHSLSTIGHLCREAMQEFASSLLGNESVAPSEADAAKTVSRVRQFLQVRATAWEFAPRVP